MAHPDLHHDQWAYAYPESYRESDAYAECDSNPKSHAYANAYTKYFSDARSHSGRHDLRHVG